MNRRNQSPLNHDRRVASGNSLIRYPYLAGRMAALLATLVLAGCGPGSSTGEATATATPFAPETIAASPTEIALPTEVFTETPEPTETAPPEPTGAPSETAPPPDKETPAGGLTELPDPAGYSWQPVVGGLSSPIGLANAGDGSGRLFVLEQAGAIRIIQEGFVLDQRFLDIRERVGTAGNEQGLLGLAFHPAYAENGYFYVNYTDLNGDTVIARYSVSEDPNRADPDSESVLLRVAQPYQNHNGGMVAFGPDGYLYLGLGDGGSGGDPLGNGQSTDTLLGKILRLDVDGGQPYAIPPDNPFAESGGLPEIWAYGLRNPWRFSFDAATGDLYIGDVGQNQWEEIDFLPAGHPGGANFGWNTREGMHPFEGAPPEGAQLIEPVAEYSHSDRRCSVTGGYVYRGAGLRAWQGVYLYADYCTGEVWGLLRTPEGEWSNERLFDLNVSVTSFGLDEAGELYLLERGGTIYRLAADS